MKAVGSFETSILRLLHAAASYPTKKNEIKVQTC